jgi:chemotaxis signal transduction protein
MGSESGPEVSPHHVLVVRVGGRRLAIPVESLRRIVRALQVFPLPGAEARFAGLAQLGGEPLPVMDLGVLVGAAERTVAPNRLAVVVGIAGEAGEHLLGLAVDEAVEVMAASADDQPTASGRVRVGGEEIEMFDLAQLRRES